MRPLTRKKIRIITLLAICIAGFVSLAGAQSFKYESHGKRDPFAPLIGQDKGSVGKLVDITSAEDLRLEGIASGPGGKNTAILNGEMVKAGQKIGEVTIKNITADAVEILMGDKTYSLKLSEEGGSKSER